MMRKEDALRLGIGNSYEAMVEEWRAVERCRGELARRHKRFCTRELLRCWLGELATDELMAAVCAKVDEKGLCPAMGGVPFGGWDLLPPPESDPRRTRAVLRALTEVALGLRWRQVDSGALDRAYSAVFVGCRPIDVAKKGK